MVVVDEAGKIVLINAQTEEVFEYQREELLGRDVEVLLPERFRERHRGHRMNFFAEPCVRRMGAKLELFGLRKAGAEFPAEVSLSPVETVGGVLVTSAIRDVTERKLMNEARLRLAAIVESSDDAIIGKDTDGIITDWNKGAERLYGYSADEMIGKPISILVPSGHVDDVVEIMAKIRAGETIKHFETVRQKKDGTLIEVSLTVSPIFDSERRIIGASAIARDISERKHQEAALRESEEALRQKGRELSEAQRLARVGSWYHDARSGTVTWSEELYRIADLDPSSPSPTDEDLPRHFAAESWKQLQPCIQEALRNGTSYELDLEMARSDGTTRWVKAHGEPVIDTTGRIVGLRGTAQDITERKLAEEALAGISRKLLEAQEHERARIGRELHDDVTQRLAMLALELDQIHDTPSDVKPLVREVQKRMTEISSDVQAMSHDLHSSKLEYLGVAAGIKSWCKEFGERHRMQIDFNSNVSSVLPLKVGVPLFRVLQEALHNVIKHSGVRQAEVQLREDSGEIHLIVSDLGIGFDVEAALAGKGLGLTSMRERVRLVNGTIVIESKLVGGTTVHVHVPFKSEHRSQAAG
jgi:PAS domain S-box-containing protein